MMDYGPDWPPRPAAPRQRLDVPMLRPFGLWMRTVFLILLVGAFFVASLRGGYLTTMQLHIQDGPHTTYATTTVHPVAGGGQPRHQPAH